jgi:hypothetical protein
MNTAKTGCVIFLTTAFLIFLNLSQIHAAETKGKTTGKARTPSQPGWVRLLDKNLSKWGNYLSFSHKNTYDGKKPVDENGQEISPVGYNKDEKHVFSVSETGGQLVLRISGEIYGCIFTKQEYGNYHLKLQVKWGTLMFGPRVGKLKDSGILYNSTGEAGVDYWRSWMLSQEFQIMQGHMGDYWSIGSSSIDIRAYQSEGKMDCIANEKQTFLSFGAGSQDGMCIRNGYYEKPDGEWNTIELISFEGKNLHIVNGHVVMVLKNSRYVENGKSIPMIKGKIQLQSEGSEVFYKDIQIKKLNAMPKQYSAYFN